MNLLRGGKGTVDREVPAMEATVKPRLLEVAVAPCPELAERHTPASNAAPRGAR